MKTKVGTISKKVQEMRLKQLLKKYGHVIRIEEHCEER